VSLSLIFFAVFNEVIYNKVMFRNKGTEFLEDEKSDERSFGSIIITLKRRPEISEMWKHYFSWSVSKTKFKATASFVLATCVSTRPKAAAPKPKGLHMKLGAIDLQ
jgi:hypothetical protein